MKAPGISETAIKQVELFVAAENVDQVWDHAKYIRDDPERHFIGVWEKVAMLTVLPASSDIPESQR